MKTTKYGMTVLLALSMVLTGCKCVYVTAEHKAKIVRYRADGRLAQAKAETGRTVSLAPTIAWSLLPGANQIHIMRKIKQSPYVGKIQQDYPGLTASLTAEGSASLMFSWIPYVYYFTMPIELGTSISDVFAVNNLVWMYSVDSKEKQKVADSSKSISKNAPSYVSRDKKEEVFIVKKTPVAQKNDEAKNKTVVKENNGNVDVVSLESMLKDGLISQEEYNRLKVNRK